MSDVSLANRPAPDALLRSIADYVKSSVPSPVALGTARLCLMDSLGCGILALDYPACVKLLGPVVPGATLVNGVRIPGTQFQLEPVQAAFNLGAQIRWLDFNDTWLAQEWGHPSDNFGGILAIADYLARNSYAGKQRMPLMREVLEAAVRAYEIQGVLALKNSFNRVGLDHVLLVKVATTAVVTQMLGGSEEQIINAISNAWVDGQSLRTYRHAPNTGSRKSWAAGDATSRGVRLAFMAMLGEMGYPSALSAPIWGFEAVSFGGKPIVQERPLASYVMENILFKISYPAEFHAQTAVECAILLQPQIVNRLDAIEEVILFTQESAVRIIDKKGPLHNPADRDHCLQYMAAIGLIFGKLEANHYEDSTATDPRIDALREKMKVVEDPRYTREYLDPDRRSIGNAIQIRFRDGSTTEKVEVEYPIGHLRRRQEGVPKLQEKFKKNLSPRFSEQRILNMMNLFADTARFDATPVQAFMDLWVPESG